MLFEKLPEVKTCCCCLPLKLGVVLIASYFIILSLLEHGVNVQVNDLSKESCYASMYGIECPYKDTMQYLVYLVYFQAFMAFLPSFFLIMAVIIKNRVIVTCFMYFITLAVVIDFAIDIAMLTFNVTEPACRTHDKTIIFQCVSVHVLVWILFIYFTIVVKSYRTSIKEYHSRHDVTDSHGNKILTDKNDNIAKYGRIKVTRIYSNDLNTESALKSDENKDDENKSNTKRKKSTQIAPHFYKTSKNVYNLRISSNRATDEEENNNSVTDDSKSKKNIQTEIARTSAHVNITSTQTQNLNTTVAKNSTDNKSVKINKSNSEIFDNTPGNTITTDTTDNKTKADANVTNADVIETNEDVNKSYTDLKRSNAALTDVYTGTSFNEIYRYASSAIDRTSTVIPANDTDENKSETESKSTVDK